MWVNEILGEINSFLWGPVMLVFFIGTGIFLTFRLRFHPWRKLGYGLKLAFSKNKDTSKLSGDITPFAALMTSLAATLGTGNIAGVATAVAIGGPGAGLWMWVTAFFGMATKYAEAVLAVRFRVKDKNGNMCGGPMYALERGFKRKRIGKALAVCFAAFAVLASFGIGNMTQANSMASALAASFDIPFWITGILLCALTALVIIGGIKNIAKVASKIVPIMAVFYILCGLIVIVLNIDNLLPGFINLIDRKSVV